MSRVTLAEVRQAAAKRYTDFPVELSDGTEVTLRSPLRLSREERGLLGDIEALAATGDTDAITETLRIAAQTPEQARRLLAEIDSDIPTAAVLFEQWAEAVSVGEASASAS